MDQPVEDGFRESWVAQASMPVLEGHLGGDEGGLATITVAAARSHHMASAWLWLSWLELQIWKP